MSFNSRNNTRKPHCAHCQNTGETEQVYTSHWPRSLSDRTGKSNITCPKLIQTECAYCYQFGHTRKFCPSLKANLKARENDERRRQQVPPTTKPLQPKVQKTTLMNVASRGGFAALDYDSDDEKVVEKEEWPTLSEAPIIVVAKIGYAAMAAKPAQLYKPEPSTPASSFQLLQKGVQAVKTEAPKPVYKRSSWLDSDSEDEDEDEDEAEYKPNDAW